MNIEPDVKVLRIRVANLVGKTAALFILSVVLGLLIECALVADAEKAETLTREEYIANYEQYKADEADYDATPILTVVLVFFISALFVVLYETLGRLLGLPVRLLAAKITLNPVKAPSWPVDLTAGFPPETGPDSPEQ